MCEELSRDTLLKIFKRAAFCRGDKNRKHISGVLLGKKVVATDGYRLAIWDRGDTGLDGSVVIPGMVLDFLWIHRDKVEIVSVDASGKVVVVLEDGTVSFKVEAEDYPDYGRPIPAHYDRCATGNTREVLRVLRGARRAKIKDVVLYIEGPTLYLLASRTSTDSVKVPIGELNGPTPDEPIKIGLCLEYLLDCLKSLEQDTFEIKLLEPLDPVVVETEDSQHVIMPMRIGGQYV